MLMTIETSKTGKRLNFFETHPHLKNHQKISSKSSNIICENHPEKIPV
jgi:hypothetical protein